MKNLFFSKYLIWIIFAATGVIYYALGVQEASLFTVVLFHAIFLWAVLGDIKLLWLTRKGTYVKGILKETEENKSQVDSDHKYIGEIEFTWPLPENKFQITHKLSSIPPNDYRYRIWVNEKDPAKSVVMEKFTPFWYYNLFAFIGLVIGAFFLEVILIKEIW